MSKNDPIQYAYNLIKIRADYWLRYSKNPTEYGLAVAYSAAESILKDALDGNWAELKAYDDYSKDGGKIK